MSEATKADRPLPVLSSEGLGAWHPIATAPRDGTWVLLTGGRCDVDESDNHARPVVAQWTNYLNGRTETKYGRWQFAWYDGGYYGEYEEPTHWMPLPAQPRTGSCIPAYLCRECGHRSNQLDENGFSEEAAYCPMCGSDQVERSA